MAAQWERLLAITFDLIDQVNSEYPIIDDWSLGGGTAMMLQIDHRDSRDIDIFLNDPQLLAYLDPARQNFKFDVVPSAYTSDGTGFLKLAFRGMGEVDFIVGQSLTEMPTHSIAFAGREMRLETVVEVVTKKIFYRGSRLAPRDIFDLAAASLGERSAILASLARWHPQVQKTLDKIEVSDPGLVTDIIMQLDLRPRFETMAGEALEITKDVLKAALATPAS